MTDWQCTAEKKLVEDNKREASERQQAEKAEEDKITEQNLQGTQEGASANNNNDSTRSSKGKED